MTFSLLLLGALKALWGGGGGGEEAGFCMKRGVCGGGGGGGGGGKQADICMTWVAAVNLQI